MMLLQKKGRHAHESPPGVDGLLQFLTRLGIEQLVLLDVPLEHFASTGTTTVPLDAVAVTVAPTGRWFIDPLDFVLGAAMLRHDVPL
jgi:hypothetical protein